MSVMLGQTAPLFTAKIPAALVRFCPSGFVTVTVRVPPVAPALIVNVAVTWFGVVPFHTILLTVIPLPLSATASRLNPASVS